MPVAWDEDDPADAPAIEANLRGLLPDVFASATRRDAPRIQMAKDWHGRIYAGTRLPVPYFAGEVRDADPRFPELDGYEVVVGGRPGAPSARVPADLIAFESAMVESVEMLDDVIPRGATPPSAEELHSVLVLCASAHGEWIRIHPFANGNGRIARMWANWCAVRYGIPPFVRLRPRPEGDAYAAAAMRSMNGDHVTTVVLFAEMLERRLRPI